jgi:hypothetical protein
MRWLDTRSARTIILAAAVLVVAAMKLPLVVAVAVIFGYPGRAHLVSLFVPLGGTDIRGVGFIRP